MKRGTVLIDNQRGFTIMEMIVAAIIFAITSLSLGYFMRSGALVHKHTIDVDIASRIAQNEAERIKAALNAQVMLTDSSYEYRNRGRVFLVERKKLTLDAYAYGFSPAYTEASEFAIEVKKEHADTLFMDFRVLYR